MTQSPEEPCFLVKGVSMYPLLRTGDRVELIDAERSTLRRGDILVFTAQDGREIIHRVVRTNPLQTRGDNCNRDDAPVPETSPLHQGVAFWHNGRKRQLSAGRAGMREFHYHQLLHRLRAAGRAMLLPLAMLNPFRVPFAKLQKSVFQEKTVYYAGKRPVGWMDKTGWHWMRFARFFVKGVPDDRRR